MFQICRFNSAKKFAMLEFHGIREVKHPQFWSDKHHHLGGGNSHIFYFHPAPCKNDPIWRAYFSNGLVQPPTSHVSQACFFQLVNFTRQDVILKQWGFFHHLHFERHMTSPCTMLLKIKGTSCAGRFWGLGFGSGCQGQSEDSRSSPQKDMGPFDLAGHPLMVVL